MIEHLISQGHRELAMHGGIRGMIPADLKFRVFKNPRRNTA
ncbi:MULTISPECIES: hypothetical protein [unclassified Oceanispirochaeta]|nr:MULTISPECIES: hypothetical protein [unclassified Oceanispirochaeta]